MNIWFPPAAVMLLQAQLRLRGPVPETEVAKLWTVPRIKVARCVEYLRSVGFVITEVKEAYLSKTDVVRLTGETSYYIGRLEDAPDVPEGRTPAAPEAGEEGGSALPALLKPSDQGDQHEGRRRRRP